MRWLPFARSGTPAGGGPEPGAASCRLLVKELHRYWSRLLSHCSEISGIWVVRFWRPDANDSFKNIAGIVLNGRVFPGPNLTPDALRCREGLLAHTQSLRIH